ncbi:MAG: hypothetical protein HYZ14_17160 [Bacteroidetes bacterium]|nr:hypothetical protein [Bacteroidota bacterium]
MHKKKKRRLILSMIQDDLVNTKLLIILDQLNSDTHHYCLNISSNIFDLMDLGKDNRKNERIYEQYLRYCKKVRRIDLKNGRKELEELALLIYGFLSLQISKK